ncbi:quinone oxidoreductase family protein [Actinophytocola xinjiangensis]|uniref:quinone oxidoreductase family protein n=1 Tax=Actinophytocola xinjiangensis TaxID=485602 RepID=UPI000A72A86E|nr:zinc-binding dehydrogenase [Actinophytocola xinjiangensis]
MRAAEIRTPGQAPVVVDRATPSPAGDRALVRVLAAPITPLDLLCASGTSYFGRPATPYVPGVQGVGLLTDRPVWFPTSAGMAPGDGAMAEYAAVAADSLVDLPAGTDPVAFAALGLSAVAALMALTDRGELSPGERVLVLGAGGVVGQAAVRLARLYGASHVIAAARSPRARERATRAGADTVVPLTTGDLPELTAALTEAADGPVDLVIDPLFGVPAAAAAATLRPGGRLVNLGSSAAETTPLTSSTIRAYSLRLLGYTNNELTPAQRAKAIRVIATHSAANELAVDHETLPLTEAATGWTRQATGTSAGRVVLTT